MRLSEFIQDHNYAVDTASITSDEMTIVFKPSQSREDIARFAANLVQTCLPYFTQINLNEATMMVRFGVND